jgi:hypothetical protein
MKLMMVTRRTSASEQRTARRLKGTVHFTRYRLMGTSQTCRFLKAFRPRASVLH